MKRNVTPMEAFSHDVQKYVRWRDDQIGYCRNMLERKLSEDRYDLHLKYQDGEIAKEAAGRLQYHFEITLGNTFRATLLAGVCAILEETMTAIIEKLIPAANKRKAALKSAKVANKNAHGHSNWLQDHITAIGVEINLSTTTRFQKDIAEFNDVITFRNCIMHTFGNIEKSKFPNEIKEALKRIDVIRKNENTFLVYPSQDGHLIFGENMVAHGQVRCVSIVDFVCRAIARQSRIHSSATSS